MKMIWKQMMLKTNSLNQTQSICEELQETKAQLALMQAELTASRRSSSCKRGIPSTKGESCSRSCYLQI
uniref:Uncharacterized protein n=1 Tax=Ciona intestinalis TaxID=7719 RepID=H2XW30_CIOIN